MWQTKDITTIPFPDFAGYYTEFYDKVKPKTLPSFWFAYYLRICSPLPYLQELTFSPEGEENSEKKKPEKKMEEPLLKLILTIAKQSNLHFRDTHSTRIIRPASLRDPHYTPDVCIFLTPDAPTHAAHIVTLFELRKKKPTKSDIGQVMTYCHSILALEQQRTEITAFILSNEWVQFVRVKCVKNEFEYVVTHPQSIVHPDTKNPLPTGLLWLYAFFSVGPAGLGFNPIDNPFHPEYIPTTRLGVGASTQGVYEVDKHPNLVFKLFKTNEAIIEADVLQKLKEWKIPNVSTVIARSEMALILFPHCKHMQGIMLNQAMELLKTLELVHKNGLVHRDIRPANLLVQANGSILVNDWGFAAPIDTKLPYAGTFIYASDAILKKLSEGHVNIQVTASDDLVSFVRTVFILTFPYVTPIFNISNPKNLSDDANKVRQMWNDEYYLPQKWHDLQDIAVKGDHEEVGKMLSYLIP